MVLIHDRILKIDIYNFEMSQITPEKSLKSNQIYSVGTSEISTEDTQTTEEDDSNVTLLNSL